MLKSYALLGTMFATFGLATLFQAWKTKQTKIHLRLFGWAFLILSLILWAFSAGKDRGVAIGLIVISLSALIVIAIQAFKDKPIENTLKNDKTKTKKNPSRISKFSLLKSGLVFFWVFFGCAIVAFITSIGVHELLWQSEMHASNSLVITLFLFPILWATFSTFTLISKKTKLKIFVFSIPVLLSLCVLWHFNFAFLNGGLPNSGAA